VDAVDPWAWWLLAAMVAALVEMRTTSLLCGVLAVGAAAAALAGYLGTGLVAQVASFAVVALSLLALGRPGRGAR
jgi:membrane protein implicated in regulation of membrane protease activity